MKNIIINTIIIIYLFYSNIALANNFSTKYLGAKSNLSRWADGKVTIVYNPTGAPTKFANQQKAVQIIQQAFTEWQNVCGIKFEFAGITNDSIDNYTDKRVVIAWRNIANIAETVTKTQANKSLGYNEYVDASIILSSNSRFFQNSNFRRTLLQQLGIVIGIGYSDNPFSFMNTNYNDNFIYFSHLMPDDIEVAQALYGRSNNFFAPPIFSPPPVSKQAIVQGNFFFISETYSSVTLPVTEITDHTRVSATDSLYFKFDYKNFPVGTVTFITVNPMGYIHSSYSDVAPANGGWSAWVATANQIKRFPGIWHFYVIGDGKTLAHVSIEAKTQPPVWNRPPSATLYIANTDDPLTVTATVHSVIDSENNDTTAIWHIPGEDVKVENFKGQVSKTITFPQAGTYQIFVEINDGVGTGFRVLKSRTITVPTTATPKFVGNLAYGRNSGVEHVFMRDENNQLRELWWTSDFSRLENLSAAVGGQTIAGDPIYFREDNGTQHIFVRDENNHLREWWWTADSGWHLENLSLAVGGQTIASNPIYFNDNGVQHIFAIDFNGHLREWWWTADSGWRLENLSLAVGGQTVRGELVYFFKANGILYIFTRDNDGHLQQWWRTANGDWHLENLYLSLGVGIIAGNPVYFNYNGVQHLFARDTNSHLREWWTLDGNWHLENLSVAVGGQTIASNPVYYNKNGKQQIFALDSEGKICQWWWTSQTGWKMFIM